jgi:hypothetical protein
MKKSEAKTVLEIMCQADGGCYSCASELIAGFLYSFPKFEKLAKEVYKDWYGLEYKPHKPITETIKVWERY